MPDADEICDMHRSKDWELRFTHADLNYSNILVEGDKVTGIIDWGTSGWYPEYWEYAHLVIDTVGAHCRLEYADQRLEPFPREFDAEYKRACFMQH